MGTSVFPERLAAARARAGLTAQDLCDRVGLKSRSVVTKWEQGKGMPGTPTMPYLAVALGTTVDHLLGADLLREVEPPEPVDLSVAASGDIPLLWSGRPLTGVDRRRAFAVLHGLLAPISDVGEISQNVKDTSDQPANTTRHRARSLADIPAKRPRGKGRSRGGVSSGRKQPMDGGDR